ncbi:Type 1 glutamine amidotransferase-like domain-containing protein [Thalassobacillus devorans]|uniref:Type 1 glutamine amidotransferase-like domain-containing protein n=1 Tax=Thalassobacillus devorans TaxID=279813 RepID=UPI00068847D2|nr:Type 1 glutamine amidotransferase-like domain-containing protein [Thalassobacillus devorans]
MIRLVLLSEWKESLPGDLEHRIMNLVGKDKPKLGYIPSQTDPEGTYFYPAKQQLEQAGFVDYLYFDVDQAFEKKLLGNLGNCDAIFLSGGNTFYFLNRLRERNMLSWLREYAEKGGVLIGVSAGAMILTESILAAEYVDAKYLAGSYLHPTEYGGIALADFHFYPHWKGDFRQLEAVKDLTGMGSKVYACPDRSGIVIEGNKREYFGHVIEF